MGLVRLRLCGIPKECDSREEEVRTCACFLGVGVGVEGWLSCPDLCQLWETLSPSEKEER